MVSPQEFDMAIEKMREWSAEDREFVASLPRAEAEHFLLAAALLDASPEEPQGGSETE